MTWSISATLSGATNKDRMRDAIDNHISLLPNWTVATPSTGTSDRNLQYDMGTDNVYARQYLYYYYSNTYDKIAGHYNTNNATTWQEQRYTGSGGMTIADGTSTYKFWTSSEMPNSFMILDDTGKAIWCWMECNKWFIIGDAGYSSTAGGMSFTLPIGFSAGFSAVGGYPMTNNYNQSSYNVSGYDMDFQYSFTYRNSFANSVNGAVVQGFRGTQKTSTNSFNSTPAYPYGLFSSSDMLLQIGSTSASMFPTSSMQKVTDGTNWWLRPCADISASSLLFPVGTSEPTF